MSTSIHTADPRQPNRTLEAFRRSLNQVRKNSSPTVAVVSNFDPDYRQSVTEAMQGYTMLQQQVGGATVGRLAVHADYGKVPPGQTAPMRPVPGQPTILYPVGGGTGSGNLSFIKGGKVDYKRYYPVKLLIRVTRDYRFGDVSDPGGTNLYTPDGVVYERTASDMDFLTPGLSTWSENSPLPPGIRYIEFDDLAAHGMVPIGAGNNIGMRLHSLGDITLDEYRYLIIHGNADDPFTDLDLFLPHDSLGNIRRNRVPLPTNCFYHLAEILADDTYWGGEVTDPLNWQDDYWDGLDLDPTGNTPRVDRDLLKTWLVAHPAARYTEG